MSVFSLFGGYGQNNNQWVEISGLLWCWMFAMNMKRRSEVIRIMLEKEYGRPVNDHDEDPLSALVHTILSQNTTDVTSERAWKALKRRYRSWRALANADPNELSETIRVGGLAQIKAGRIISSLREIERMTGGHSLDFLEDMTEEEADKWLSQLKGVGPKTRAIVLLFSLGKKAFPVDTHISRVTRRLGLIKKSASREEVQRIIAEFAKPNDYYSYHVNLIMHGRTICSARNPKCPKCHLYDICQWSERKRYSRKNE